MGGGASVDGCVVCIVFISPVSTVPGRFGPRNLAMPPGALVTTSGNSEESIVCLQDVFAPGLHCAVASCLHCVTGLSIVDPREHRDFAHLRQLSRQLRELSLSDRSWRRYAEKKCRELMWNWNVECGPFGYPSGCFCAMWRRRYLLEEFAPFRTLPRSARRRLLLELCPASWWRCQEEWLSNGWICNRLYQLFF